MTKAWESDGSVAGLEVLTERLENLCDRVDDLKGAVDSGFAHMRDHTDKTKTKLVDIDGRVRVLEERDRNRKEFANTSRATIALVATVAGMIGAGLAWVLTHLK